MGWTEFADSAHFFIALFINITIITIIAAFICVIKYNWDLNNGMNAIDFFRCCCCSARWCRCHFSLHQWRRSSGYTIIFIDVHILGIVLYDPNVYFHIDICIWAQLWYAKNSHTHTISQIPSKLSGNYENHEHIEHSRMYMHKIDHSIHQCHMNFTFMHSQYTHTHRSAIPNWSKWWFITHSWCFHPNWTGLFHSWELCCSRSLLLAPFENTEKFSFKWNLCRSPIFVSSCVHTRSYMYTDMHTSTVRFSWRIRQWANKISFVQCGKFAYMTPSLDSTDISTDWFSVVMRCKCENVLLVQRDWATLTCYLWKVCFDF